jgi:hypothetical protein
VDEGYQDTLTRRAAFGTLSRTAGEGGPSRKVGWVRVMTREVYQIGRYRAVPNLESP